LLCFALLYKEELCL